MNTETRPRKTQTMRAKSNLTSRFITLTVTVKGKPVQVSIDRSTPISALWRPGYLASVMRRSKAKGLQRDTVSVGADSDSP